MPQAVATFFYNLVATLAVSGFSASAAVALSFAATAAVVVGSIYALQKSVKHSSACRSFLGQRKMSSIPGP